MGRTKVFVSYSHRDRAWLERLLLHLSLLQRRELIHVWSDTRIGVGERWEVEIEKALGESRVAVLLVSPAFLASNYIWQQEIPRIMEHKEQGMAVLPLVVRPCAWRIAPELAELQARPPDGRPLSLGDEAEIDRDLAQFVYELAARVEQLSSSLMAQETELVQTSGSPERADLQRAGRTPGSDLPVQGVSSAESVPGGAATMVESWTGMYYPSNRRLQLTIRERRGSQIYATIDYPTEGTVTEVEGSEVVLGESASDSIWAELRARVPDTQDALSFREVGYLSQGELSVDFDGEYRAVVSRGLMFGFRISAGRTVGNFELKRDE